MYYWILILSATLTASQFLFLKLYEKMQGATVSGALLFSSFVGFFQMIIALTASGFKPKISLFSLVFAALFSLTVITCNTLGMRVMNLGKISVYTLFMMLGGMIVPLFYGVLFLNEQMKKPYIIAVMLLTLALIIPAFEKKKANRKTSKLFYPLCCVLFFVNGMVSTVSKAHQISPKAVGTVDFLFLIGLTEFLIAVILLLFVKKDEKVSVTLKKRTPILYGLGFAGVNAVASLLQFFSAKSVNASVLYPIITGGTIVFSAVFAYLFFKEKPGKLTILSISVAFSATMLFLF